MTFDLQAFRLGVLDDTLVRDVWDQKYRAKRADGGSDEASVAATRARVVRAVYVNDPSPEALAQALDLVQGGYLVPAGRINAGAGLDRAVTLINCFVNQTVQDCMPGIQRAIMRASLSMQQSGGVGTDWSTVRPAGALVKRTGSVSSGVIVFMDQMSAMCKSISSAGTRRGAMMGTLRDDHPDLWNEDQFETTTTFAGETVLRSPSFISAKRQRGRLTQFNVSVLVSDALMLAVKEDRDWDLGFHAPRADGRHVDVYDRPFTHDEVDIDNEGVETPGRRRGDPHPWYVYRRVKARRIWDDIMRSTYVYAEPGVIFIDRVHRLNNLNYCEAIRCTNPCGEQPLPEDGCCDLGSVNAAFMVDDPFTPHASFNWSLFRRAAAVGVRLLDNVLDVTRFPLAAQRLESDQKRRIGLGVTGWGDALAQLGVVYGSDESVKLSKLAADELRRASYEASARLAAERGPFPLYDKQILQNPNLQTLPSYVVGLIEKHGLRNGVLNTVAPNGTISLYIGNVSSGIEPIFSTRKATRRVRQPDDSYREYEVIDYAQRLFEAMHPGADLPAYFVGAHDVHPRDHVRVQAAWQRYIDASISKTVNCPTELPFEEFADLYAQAYADGCKGCTTYRYDPAAGRGSVLSEVKEPSPAKVDDGDFTQTLTTATKNAFEAGRRHERELAVASGTADLLRTMAGTASVAADVRHDLVKPRPDVLEGRTHKLKWPTTGENVYVNVTHDERGAPMEVFIKHADPLVLEWTDALSRMITGVLRRGGDVRFVVEQLTQVAGARGGAMLPTFHRFAPSIVAGIGFALEREFRALGVYDRGAGRGDRTSTGAEAAMAEQFFATPRDANVVVGDLSRVDPHALKGGALFVDDPRATGAGYVGLSDARVDGLDEGMFKQKSSAEILADIKIGALAAGVPAEELSWLLANVHEECPACHARSFVRENGCKRCLTCAHEACG